jgi:UDP-N-acetylmuramoyl-tripeptide--D-alanyl-D-alanine ligase
LTTAFLSVPDVIAATGGKISSGGDFIRDGLSGVSTDSRKTRPGEIFFALAGPNYDGHSFLHEAIKKGSSCAVVQRAGGTPPPPGFCLITVADTLRALGDLARFVRKRSGLPLVAISGTSGKTTTKEMASLILKKRNALKTEGNLNNLIGLPLTLLNVRPGHGAIVVELGISVVGEMERLGEIASPDVALITNAGPGHLETLRDVETVAREKCELFAALGPAGHAVVNIDDPWIVRASAEVFRRKKPAGIVTFSVAEKADVRLKEASFDGPASVDAVFLVRGRAVPVKLKAHGMMNLKNATAAVAATLPLGVTDEEISDGLSSFAPRPGRGLIETINGVVLIDDTYNANPDSMRAAGEVLGRAPGKKIALLGDMLELGAKSGELHAQVGGYMAGKADVIIAVGRFAEFVMEGAIGKGARPESVFAFADKKDGAKKAMERLEPGSALLVKGSRGMAMETALEEIRAFCGNLDEGRGAR